MKKLLSVAICASAVAAFGADVPVALGEVGVTAVTSSFTNTIVAVSYEDLGGGNVTASNLVKTTNLSLGDLLYVYNGANFDAFVLDGVAEGAKYWKPLDVVSPGVIGDISINTSSSADAVRVAAGKGIWLVRPNGWAGSSFTFYIYGKPTTSTSVSVTAGTSMLVGNPKSAAQSPTITTPNIGDMIMVPNEASKTGMRKYTYETGGWRYSYKVAPTVAAPSIPAGMGFWYVAHGDGSGATVSW